jgi:diguanylate cyclase (GGDEF)-like protein/PAS domain S-box-containing protein
MVPNPRQNRAARPGPACPERSGSAQPDSDRGRQESEACFRSLFENASDGILLFDERGTIEDANPQMLAMLGCTLDDLRGHAIASFLDAEDGQAGADPGLARLADGETVIRRQRLRCRDGRSLWVEHSVQRVHAQRGLSFVRSLIFRDQTEATLLETLRDAEDSENQLEEAISRVNTMAMDAEVASLEMDQVFNATSDGICVIDRAYRITKFNRVLRDMMAPLGLQVAAGSCRQIFAHPLCGTERCLLDRIFNEGCDRIEEEIEITPKQGRQHTFIVTARPLMDLTAETVGAVVSYRDITSRKQIEEELRRLATIDPLTGAFNRRHFVERAREEIDRSRRYHTDLTMLMIDIDHFKAVNDTYGHDAGDAVLKRMVAECRGLLRGSDIFCRLGGEEFAVILTHTSPDQGRLAAERLRKAVKALAVETAGGTVRFTVSIGVASMMAEEATMDQVMKMADDALYEAKQMGRNRVIVAE